MSNYFHNKPSSIAVRHGVPNRTVISVLITVDQMQLWFQTSFVAASGYSMTNSLGCCLLHLSLGCNKPIEWVIILYVCLWYRLYLFFLFLRLYFGAVSTVWYIFFFFILFEYNDFVHLFEISLFVLLFKVRILHISYTYPFPASLCY